LQDCGVNVGFKEAWIGYLNGVIESSID